MRIKITISNKKFTGTTSRAWLRYSKNLFLRSYLAGLIERDGTIYVPKKAFYMKQVCVGGKIMYKKQNNYPQIKICFVKDDYPLAKKLQAAFGGCFEWSKKKTYVVLKFQSIGSVYMVARLINGYLRTPKVKKFQSLVSFGNRNLQYSMKAKAIDQSDLSTNAWQTGFSEADSNFSINITTRNKDTGNIRVQTTYRQELSNKMNFKLDSFDNNVYETKDFLLKICNFFGGSLYTRNRTNKTSGKVYTSLTAMCFNRRSVKKVYDYFSVYPFKGSKYNNFQSWGSVVQLPKPLDSRRKQECLSIRKNYNSTRTEFDWSHLDSWKFSFVFKVNKRIV